MIDWLTLSNMRLGITGGIGCGKSTAAQLFETLGWRRIDCDAVVHGLLANDVGVKGRIVERFGAEVLGEDGAIVRSALGAIVFADSRALKDLEAILHPETSKTWEGMVETEPDANWVIEIPLLFEKKLENRVDLTVCVFSDLSSQLTRLERKGMNRHQAMARIEAQIPLSEKAEKADFTLLNDGSLSFLETQVKQLVSRIQNI